MSKHSYYLSLGKLKSAFFTTIVLSLVLISAIAIALPFFSNLVGGSDTSSIAIPLDNYGKPNQSRIWYNSSQGRWDALIPKNDGGSFSQSDHFIMTDVPGAQTFTTVELADRDNSRPDVFWDDQNKKLYVLASHPSSSQFWRLGYDAASDSYNFEVGGPGTGVMVPNFTHIDGNSPASIYMTPNGRVWLAVMKTGQLLVQHSSNGGANWMAAPINLDNSVMSGVTTWIDFKDQGVTHVGVFAGENGEMAATTDFLFWYIDQDDDPSIFNNWIDDSANIPPSVGIEQSDNHVSAARDLDENQYFAVKTESGGPTDPLIKLFKRTPAGVWSQFKVTETQEVPEESRPSIVIDDENREIYIYTNGAEIVGPNLREGSRVKASLDSLEDLETAPFVRIFSQPNTVFTDLITPKHSVNSNTDIVVLAHNRFDETVWYSEEDIQLSSGLVSVPDVVGLSQAAAQAAIVGANLVVGTVSTANSNTVPAGIIISQNPGNPESFRDNFNTRSFTNNNGTLNWTGGWIEVDGAGAGPTAGNARIGKRKLSLDDRPDTGGEPSLAREADLSGFTVATLSFRFRTTARVDPTDSVVVEISDNGGANWTILEDFTEITGRSRGKRNFDISGFISNNTQIRFRVNNLYGGSREKFRLDNVKIEVTGNLVPLGTAVDLVVSLGSAGGNNDDD